MIDTAGILTQANDFNHSNFEFSKTTLGNLSHELHAKYGMKANSNINEYDAFRIVNSLLGLTGMPSHNQLHDFLKALPIPTTGTFNLNANILKFIQSNGLLKLNETKIKEAIKAHYAIYF